VAVRAGSGTAQASARATATTSGDTARLRLAGGGTADVSFPASSHRLTTHSGVAADQWRTTAPLSSAGRPATVTLDDLVALFGRIPVGISADQQPGPFTAKWTGSTTTSLWTAGGGLLDTRRTQTTVLTLSGGGLTSSRTYTVDAGAATAGSSTPTWSVPASRVASSSAAVQAAALDAAELRLWNTWLPLALGVAAVWQAALLVAGRRRRATDTVFPSHPAPADAAPLTGVEQDDPARSTPYAVR
jgi:high-affinity iron transporter